MLRGMADDPIRTKPEPPQQAKSGGIISLADRDQDLRHEAARRLAKRPPPHAAWLIAIWILIGPDGIRLGS